MVRTTIAILTAAMIVMAVQHAPSRSGLLTDEHPDHVLQLAGKTKPAKPKPTGSTGASTHSDHRGEIEVI